jgi:hypothetical protein
MHAAGDAPGTTRPPVKAVAGTTYFRFAKYNPIPWGNYSTTCLDPLDPSRFWTYQEYANSTNDGEWSTTWASFQFNPLPAPVLTNIRSAPGNCMFDATGLVSGVSYQLQSANSLTNVGWSNAPAFTAPAPAVTLTNSTSNSPQGFYRLLH